MPRGPVLSTLNATSVREADAEGVGPCHNIMQLLFGLLIPST